MRIRKKSCSSPIMAVLVSSKSISNLENQIAGTRIQLLVKANNEVENILYFFSLRGVNLKEHKIIGYYWHNTSKMWLRGSFSIPDILYVKGKIEKENEKTFTGLCKIVTKNNGELITHYRFNKWRLYQVMEKDPVMKTYLPVTRTVKQPDDIEKMLKRYKLVYLKTHIGRLGENIIRVVALSNGGYQYSYYRDGTLTFTSVTSFQSLLKAIDTFYQGRDFIIQQGIELLNFKNKLIDMRAELQRKGDGSLEVVGISVRYGKSGSPITTHGDAIKFDDFFVKNMGYSNIQLETLRSAIHNFLFSVYEYIDKNYGKYAELGIDFAIDSNNKIWFIEANAQSTKVSLNKAYGNEALYRYYKNILEYARYLSDQSKA